MPIIIEEVVVRAVVTPPSPSQGPAAETPGDAVALERLRNKLEELAKRIKQKNER